MNTIGERIKDLRRELNLTQDAFAARINLTRNYITLIEAGNRTPSPRTIVDICREFHISQSWLENGIEPKYIDQDESDIDVINRIMEGQSENKKKLMRILADMPDELLDKMLDYLESKYNA